jgi:hypothetical protein
MGAPAQERLKVQQDNITSHDAQWSSVTSSAVLTAAGTVFTINSGEIGVIENENNAVLFVKFGPTASATSYNKILKAGTAAADGTGGACTISNYIGEVSVFSATTYSYIAYKFQ